MKLSLLMSTYNGEKFILEQLQSILEQSRELDEIVVIDDCSTDDTVSKVNSFIRTHNLTDKWKIYVNEINLGWRINFFSGIERTSGDICFFCDQDDIWFKDKVRVQSAILENNADIMVIGSPDKPYRGGKYSHSDISSEFKKLSLGKRGQNFQMAALGCAMAFRRSFYDRIKLYHIKEWAHDEFMWRMALIHDALGMMKNRTLLHRLHGDNCSTTKRNYNSTLEIAKNSILRVNTVLQCLSDNADIIDPTHCKYETVSKIKLSMDKRLKFLQDKKISLIPTLFRDKYKIYRKKKQIVKDILLAFGLIK